MEAVMVALDIIQIVMYVVLIISIVNFMRKHK